MLLTSTRYVVWLILPVQLGLWLFGGSFIGLWVEPRYVATSYPTLAILAAPLAFAMAQSVSVRFLYGLGRLKWYARFMLAEAGLNLLLSLVLVRYFGIEGVALGTAIPNVLANLAVLLMICRILNIGIADYLRQVFVRPLLGTALLALGWWLALDGTPLTTWTGLILTGALGLAGYGVVAVLLEFGPRGSVAWLRRHLRTRPPTEPERPPSCSTERCLSSEFA
jgi:O-antigen/teichoic acid export membrane protein